MPTNSAISMSLKPLANNYLLAVLASLTLVLTSCKGNGETVSRVNEPSPEFAESTGPAEPLECNSVTYQSPLAKESKITFTFDAAYLCGQFANGDWWVSEGRRGYVQIDSISPDAIANAHGSEVNPSESDRQGFDDRIYGHDKTLAAAFPLKVEGVSSVVKTISTAGYEDNHPPCRPCLDYAAVLTVTSEPVKDSREVLRPSYFGQEKRFYRLNEFENLKARQLTADCCEMSASVKFDALAQRYQGVQLDHLTGWGGRNMHPRHNMPDYGASIARDNAIAVLRMLLDDFDIHNASHKAALVNYLQMGVDLEGMALNGVGWPAAGGHGNGRKLPILFTGWVLGKESFGQALETAVFSEDGQVYWSEKAQRSLFGQNCSDAGYWSRMRTGAGAKDCRDPYGYIDGHGYQFCCTAMPWKYTALAVVIMDSETQWNNDPLLDYAHRWVNHGVWAEPDPCAPYNGDPEDYGRSYGPDASGNCIQGTGRHIYSEQDARHGSNRDEGNYGAEFGDELWAWFWQVNGKNRSVDKDISSSFK
ncbi:hypothetical protein [Marinobacter salicampi]|uniref:hypothetical protein n=1 Tax=Marinobacter salicampi TaxID=435907 RepID=UPI00140A06A8|nr:hypothetical protein [Marinobacter salicampi]